MKENNIDELIKKSLNEEELKFYNELDENSVYESFYSILKGKNKMITIFGIVITFILFVVFVYTLIQFKNTDNTTELIKLSTITILLFIAIGFIKTYFWMQMNNNIILREIKRVELQISLLSRNPSK